MIFHIDVTTLSFCEWRQIERTNVCITRYILRVTRTVLRVSHTDLHAKRARYTQNSAYCHGRIYFFRGIAYTITPYNISRVTHFEKPHL